ncbi:MAG: hypothetical protein AB7I30_09750 [Isosphaeraceae bacterium]
MFSLLVASSLVVGFPEAEGNLRQVGTLEHPAIRESSGVVASRRHQGVFWVHNDSGNPPWLFAVRKDGRLIREYRLNVPNVDWEDLALDDQGHLYLGDVGNNQATLPVRMVYRLDEPDPFAKEAEASPKLRVSTAIYYRFGPEGRFDAESLAVSPDGRTALLVAKTFDGRDAEVYELPLVPPAPLLRPAVPRRIGTLPGLKRPATGADLRADGLLAVVSKGQVGVYRRNEAGDWRRVGGVHFVGGGDVEAIAWAGSDLILTSEGRGVFQIDEAQWRGRDGR